MPATRRMLPGLVLACAVFAVPAAATETLDALAPLAADELQTSRGGQETVRDLTTQANETNQGANNDLALSMDGHATKTNGGISAATVTGNHGMTTLMQNTGDGVNMQNATNVNIFMR